MVSSWSFRLVVFGLAIPTGLRIALDLTDDIGMADDNKNRSYSVLVVDDEQDLCEIIASQLEVLVMDQPIVIDMAFNGAEALKKCEQKWYDAVISDLNMPLMTGLQMLGELRSHGKDTPVVFLTAFGDKQKAVEALRLGAFDFLDKPWKAELLRQTMLAAIQLGAQFYDVEQELDQIVSKYTDLSDERRKQLRNVHRALLLIKTNRVA